MHSRFSLCAVALLFWLSWGSLLNAHVTTVALSHTAADDVPTAIWETLSLRGLNNTGEIAFSATLQEDGSGVTSSNAEGVWLFDGVSNRLVARTGSGGVPGVGGASFSRWLDVSLSNLGRVTIHGVLESGEGTGIWQFENLGESLLIRTNSGNVPGIPGADFTGFPLTPFTVAPIAVASNGQVAFKGNLAVGVGGVFSNNSSGVWSYGANTSTLIARRSSLHVPGVPGASFNLFELPEINSQNQIAVSASMLTGGGVSVGNWQGIWRYTGSSGELLARTGVGNVAGVPGADFASFDSSRLNDSGEVAFRAELSTGQNGIWLDAGNSGSLLALSGAGNVPDVPGADFAELGSRSINNAGQVLVSAGLELGVGGVTADNDQGIWLLGGEASLIARTGSGDVPGLPGANFAAFQESALNAHGQVAFAAELQTSETGIWIVDPLGDSWLVAREGDLLAGQTIASLDFVTDSAGQTDSFNDAGELAFHATFTNGDSGLFLFRPYAADFDRDGGVDSDDLAEWETAFAATPAADADSDGDTDGADFLAWQREFGNGVVVVPIVVEVPEPASGLLLGLGLLLARRHKCCRR